MIIIFKSLKYNSYVYVCFYLIKMCKNIKMDFRLNFVKKSYVAIPSNINIKRFENIHKWL